ncbi:hypothetical protein [Micromonospora carbonacea]|uniref:hypothetical protein n=1 Tax=Micromonospora carbonacea TaxID=47853 RepID=UPI0037102496
MTDSNALYRTVVRLAAIDDNTITLIIPATDFDQVTFARDNIHIPCWLLGKEIGYRFFALINIHAERPEHVMLWNCENDPRSRAEQVAHLGEVFGADAMPAQVQP